MSDENLGALARQDEKLVGAQPLLGLATTKQLLRELSVRSEVSSLVDPNPQPALWLQAVAEGMLQVLPEHLLNYRTVDSG